MEHWKMSFFYGKKLERGGEEWGVSVLFQFNIIHYYGNKNFKNSQLQFVVDWVGQTQPGGGGGWLRLQVTGIFQPPALSLSRLQ